MSHAPEVRKTVTVIFTDVTGWTSLGDGMDPESLRRVMSRYFDEMRQVIERHGGRVEKYIGDAIMAVFGIPELREDDALRAVRAAVGMRDKLHDLNKDLERDHGVRIEIRTGVNTGEVVVGTNLDEVLATGEPVTIAARLEQTAAPGEILIGDATHALVKDAADAQDAGSLALKGKSDPVRAWRLVSVGGETPGVARRLTSPLVGRARELSSLEDWLARAISGGDCQAVTLLADAGVGKSRLAAEFTSLIADSVTVARGRCLPYGEDITFWPIADVVRQLADVDAEDSTEEMGAKIEAVLAGDSDAADIGNHLAAVVGMADTVYPIQETYWAIRRFLESSANNRPLVVAFDDIHWADATFLDLIEYLWGWSTTAPILLLCSARPELVDTRPGWGLDAKSGLIRLAPLTPDECHRVIDNLVAGDGLDQSARGRIIEIAEGNPLFVEEIFRMVVDAGMLVHDESGWTSVGDLSAWDIPPTVNALLDARLEGIPAEERRVLQRASVMGKLFSWTAITELSPKDERGLVGAQLQALVRRGMIHPDRSDAGGGDGFAFSHVLVRDAAYRSVAKEMRATLHRRFARWLEALADGTDRYDEVTGYHLEQSVRAHAELGMLDDRDRKLAKKAARQLGDAGGRAFARFDLPATIGLLSRAIALLDDTDPLWIEIATDLGAALSEHGDQQRAHDLLTDAAARAEAYGDDRLAAHVVLERWFATDNTKGSANLRADAESALQVFTASNDDRGISRALRALGDIEYAAGRIAARDTLMERALKHARRAGDVREIGEIQHTICVDLNLGPTHAIEGIRRCEELLAEGDGGRTVAGSLFHALAHLRAMRGEFDEAMTLAEQFRGFLMEGGALWSYWFFAEVPFNVKMLAGKTREAVDLLADAYEHLSELGEPNPMIAAMLSQGLYKTGDYHDARRMADVACDHAATWVMSSRQQARGVLAKLLAREGKTREAEEVAREAVAFFEATDFLVDHGVALMDLGEVLDLSGRPADAAVTVSAAVDLFERKGDIVSAAKATKTYERLVS